MAETIVEVWKEAGARLAKRRFPQHASRIDGLLADSATFREVCEALGEAEAAQLRLAGQPSMAARLEQWLGCIRGLEAEIEAMIDRGNVISLRATRPDLP